MKKSVFLTLAKILPAKASALPASPVSSLGSKILSPETTKRFYGQISSVECEYMSCN